MNYHRFLITLTVMLVAVAEVLDMTIVNVALPPMMGSLGANTEQITWVLTSYIVFAAICMPMTGFLVKRWGRKRLLMASIAGFLAASIFCGMAGSLSQLVFFRSLQGIFGASLVPLAQYILRDAYPPEEHGKAMAIWGIGIMAGPVLGPTLGGIITDSWSWRWVFYINVPVCCISLLLAWRTISETPRQKDQIDWLGMGLLTVGVACLQLFLDRGNAEDWFQSHIIQVYAITACVCLGWFVHHALHHPNPVINLRLFRDRNFALSTLIILLFAATMFGLIALQPILMENVMGYSSKTTGILMAPRGIASAVGMVIVSRLISNYDARYLLFTGLVITAIGTYAMTGFTANSPASQIINVGIIQGLGLGLFFVPLSTLAFAHLSPEDGAEASGLFSFGRSLGSSIGISILSTLTSRSEQYHWQILASHITANNANLQSWLHHQHWTLLQPAALSTLIKLIHQQASMIAFINVFFITCFGYLVLAPFVLSIKR